MEQLPLMQNLDDFQKMLRTSKVYPLIVLKAPTDELTVLIGDLPKGELPLALPIRGKLIQVAKIKKSPDALNMILRVRPFTLCVDENHSYEIKTIAEVLDLEEFTWT